MWIPSLLLLLFSFSARVESTLIAAAKPRPVVLYLVVLSARCAWTAEVGTFLRILQWAHRLPRARLVTVGSTVETLFFPILLVRAWRFFQSAGPYTSYSSKKNPKEAP